jgi:hypothetical protein
MKILQPLALLLLGLLIACGGPPTTEVKNTFQDGLPSETYSLNGDSLRDGPYTSYYPGGKPFEALVYKKGLLWEVVSIKDANGKELAAKTLAQGNGYLPRYDQMGQLIAKIPYKHGLPDGPMEVYEPGSDQKLLSLNFVQGLLVSNDHPLLRARIAQAPVDTSSNTVLPKGPKVPGFTAAVPNRFMRLLLNKAYEELHAAGHPLYKQRYQAKDLSTYLGFVQEVLGPLKGYQIDRYDAQQVPGQGNMLEVVYKAQFLNADGVVQLLLVQKDTSTYLLGNLGIQTIPGSPIAALAKLGNPIMQLIQDKKPEAIYSQAGPELKKVPEAQFKGMFAQIYKVGDVKSFTLHHNEFFLVDGMAGVSLLYKVQLGDREIPMQLIFSRKDGKYQLEGINA